MQPFLLANRARVRLSSQLHGSWACPVVCQAASQTATQAGHACVSGGYLGDVRGTWYVGLLIEGGMVPGDYGHNPDPIHLLGLVVHAELITHLLESRDLSCTGS